MGSTPQHDAPHPATAVASFDAAVEFDAGRDDALEKAQQVMYDAWEKTTSRARISHLTAQAGMYYVALLPVDQAQCPQPPQGVLDGAKAVPGVLGQPGVRDALLTGLQKPAQAGGDRDVHQGDVADGGLLLELLVPVKGVI
jgi:hypothetical protein